ncbi:MAG TPA: TOPRIM nucleotidyl transferase/hydrolase domain-containing protein [Jiangellaceae bacterium]|nr:TOPRIM nucleotidyl transferase/hydrolase domain-containing protein [Jiangellaceae bacterium]
MTTLRAVVLVEGNSDRVALHNLAERRGRDLGLEGIEFVTWAGSPTRGHSRRDTGRTGSASAVPVRLPAAQSWPGHSPTVDQA